MANAGKRYPLLVYTRMMDRWWPPVFWIGAGLLALTWWQYQDLYVRLTQPWKWMALAGAGALAILASLLMLASRKSAYVRAFGDHFLLATPFLRMNVSYRRILRTSTASMGSLFPPTKRMPALQRETIAPLLRLNAVVVDLNTLPMPRATLRLFLSPLFFKDQTPHIVLLVQNWMGFSTELESKRASAGVEAATVRRPQSSILSGISRK
jgi:hypothetical protein